LAQALAKIEELQVRLKVTSTSDFGWKRRI